MCGVRREARQPQVQPLSLNHHSVQCSPEHARGANLAKGNVATNSYFYFQIEYISSHQVFAKSDLQLSDVNVFSFFKNLPWLGASHHTVQEGSNLTSSSQTALPADYVWTPPFSDLFKLNRKEDVSDKLHPPTPGQGQPKETVSAASSE